MANRIFNAVRDMSNNLIRSVSDLSNNIQRVYNERANDDIKWNLFSFSGCTLQNSQYRDPNDPQYVAYRKQIDKVTQSPTELARRENAGRWFNLGDFGYNLVSEDLTIPGRANSTNSLRLVDYVNYDALWAYYEANGGVLSNSNTRLTFKKTPQFYNYFYPDGSNNLIRNRLSIMKEFMEHPTSLALRQKIGSNNFLYLPDDNDYEVNNIPDSLTPSVIKNSFWALHSNYIFGNSPTHPQIAQSNARLAANPSQFPGYYFTAAYELEPNKYVQVIGLDNRTFRTGTYLQIRRDVSGGNFTDIVMMSGEDSSYPRVLENGETTLGSDQLIWLRNILQRDGYVPGYTKDGKPQNIMVPQSKIYFRAMCHPTQLIATEFPGISFQDDPTKKEVSVILHLINGGDISKDASGVINFINKGVYTDASAVKGVFNVISNNHRFEYFQMKTDLSYNGVYPPYNINEYGVSTRCDIASNTAPLTADASNTYIKGTWSLTTRRDNDASWNTVLQPSTLLVEFNLRNDGFETMHVRAVTFGNLLARGIRSGNALISFPELLTGNIFDSGYISVLDETIRYTQLRKNGWR